MVAAAGRGVGVVAPDREEEAELLARLAEARKVVRRAVAAAGLDPGLAAAACAELAGEYATTFAAARGLPPEPLLEVVAGVVRWGVAAADDAPELHAA